MLTLNKVEHKKMLKVSHIEKELDRGTLLVLGNNLTRGGCQDIASIRIREAHAHQRGIMLLEETGGCPHIASIPVKEAHAHQ